jgi:hypothetical protein
MPFFMTLERETAAEREALFAVPQIRDGLAGRISRDTYLAYLGQAYHHVRHTVPLLTLAHDRMGEDHALFRFALEGYITEEAGHDAWILNDIARCSPDPQLVRLGAPSAATELMVETAYHQARKGNPMGIFGMVYVLEGTSVAIASKGAAAVGAALGLGPECFSYLISHGELDQDHLGFFAGLMDHVVLREDQAAILAMAQRMFELFADVFRSIPHPRSLADAV